MNIFLNQSKRQFTLDKILLALLITAFTVSVIGIYLAGPLMNGGSDVALSLIKKQLMWFAIGLFLVWFLNKTGVERLFTAVDVMYWILMALLFGLVLAHFGILKFAFMSDINGTNAWYQIPGIGSFQPSEFMKIVLVIKSANIIEQHNIDKKTNSWRSDFELIFKMAKWALPPLFLIFLQPDTGIPIVIVISLATMFMVSGVRREWFFIISFIALGSLFGVVFLYRNHPDLLNTLLGGGKNEYRLTRFYGWLDYEKHSADYGFQLFQSLISYGTAGLTGHPLGQAIAVFPESQTDFIFAVLAQNFGFLGGAFVIILSFAIVLRLTYIVLKSNLLKERYMLIGVIGMLLFQVVENIGMILAILPITGITLPFISYGGSSTLSYMIPLAVAFHIYSDTQNRHKHFS